VLNREAKEREKGVYTHETFEHIYEKLFTLFENPYDKLKKETILKQSNKKTSDHYNSILYLSNTDSLNRKSKKAIYTSFIFSIK
jgi:hypothetical protein